MFAWFSYNLWFYVNVDQTYDYMYHVIRTIALSFMLSGYVLVLYETYKSSTMGYLKSHWNHEGDAEQFIRKLIKEEPTVTTKVKAWHNKKKTETTNFVDPVTRQTIRTETRTVSKKKVVTWEGVHHFYFDHWDDLSDHNSIPRAQGDDLLRIKLRKRIILALSLIHI